MFHFCLFCLFCVETKNWVSQNCHREIPTRDCNICAMKRTKGFSCYPSRPCRQVRARLALEEEEEDKTEEGDDVVQLRNIVYFHAPVSRATILKLIQKMILRLLFLCTNKLRTIVVSKKRFN